jgi:hypothetical protein
VGIEMTSAERKRNVVLAALLGTLELISLLGFIGCLLALADLQSMPSIPQGMLLF